MIKNIRLWAAFMTPPIFNRGQDDYGPVELDGLSLSNHLKSAVQAWDAAYQATFNEDYPPDSCFKTPEEAQKHAQEGHELAVRLQQELGDGYKVEYLI